MPTQEEILNLIINNGGAISTREIREIYNINSGLGHISQRLRQLMKKKIISKVRGLNGEVIYFLIDLSFMQKPKNRRKKYGFNLKEIEEDFRNGLSITEVANKYGMSYMWAWRLHKRFLKEGVLQYKKDGRPYKQI